MIRCGQTTWHQDIAWSNVDPLCHMASLSPDGLTCFLDLDFVKANQILAHHKKRSFKADY